MQVVQQCRQAAVGWREQFLLEPRERVAVRVPGLVVAQVDLDQRDAGFDQPSGHQQRPAIAVAAVADLLGVFFVGDVKGMPYLGVVEQRDGSLTEAAEISGLDSLVQVLLLFLDVS